MNRRTGKIARFPKDLRELVNNLLDDGAQYESIIRALDQHRHRWPDGIAEITVNNLSTWHAGGYQDWLKANERLEQHESTFELAQAQAKLGDPTYQDAGIYIAQLQFYEALNRLDGTTLSKLASEQPKEFIHLLKTFTHFNRYCLERDKFRNDLGRQQKAEQDHLKPPRQPVTPENLEMLCEKFGLK